MFLLFRQEKWFPRRSCSTLRSNQQTKENTKLLNTCKPYPCYTYALFQRAFLFEMLSIEDCFICFLMNLKNQV